MNKKILTLTIMLACAAMVALFCGPANAAVTGVCSNCHTMHDSQAGTQMGTDGEQKYLTLYSCLACHTENGASDAPKIDGKAGTDGKGSGSSVTAGGDYNLGDQDQRHDLVFGDGHDMAPPGYISGGGLTWGTEMVTCEGTYGCHGKHPTVSPGVAGSHHGSETAYRWLYVQAGNTGGDGTAVNGVESATWEAGGALTTNHNVYDGDGDDSISGFCANCHGDFHGDTNTGSSSPFTRHPTDGDAVIDNIVTTSFTPSHAQLDETPFAFTSAHITAGMLTSNMTDGTAYTAANGKAMCMSCHRAHGTNVDDILRFSYDMNAGGGAEQAGCVTCHIAQQ